MPELPSVETARRAIERNFLNLKIESVRYNTDDKVYLTEPETVSNSLIGNYIHSTERCGKWLWINIAGSKNFETQEYQELQVLLFHLGMTGTFQCFCLNENQKKEQIQKGHLQIWMKNQNKNEPELPKVKKLLINFENETTLLYTNARRLGKIKLLEKNQNPKTVSPILELGFDPINSMISENDFSQRVLSKNKPIKSLLLDQGFSAGIGNWIADEILYQSSVHPLQICSTLNEDEISKVYENSTKICEKAVDCNDSHSKFPKEWLFHFRWEKKKQKSAKDYYGEKIYFLKAGGRTSAIIKSKQVLRETESQTKKRKLEKKKEKKGKKEDKKGKKRKVQDKKITKSRKKKKLETEMTQKQK